MRAGPSHRVFPPLGRLRIEQVEAGTGLSQILQLRAAALGRSISLTPDFRAWADPLDMHASHWCVFTDHALVAAARLSVHHAGADDLLAGHRAAWQRPVASMSHCVVAPGFERRALDAMLDAVRIERARQMRCATLVATPESLRRARALAALGFTTRDGILVLDLAREDEHAPAIARHPRTG